jgi:hypothetical protein
MDEVLTRRRALYRGTRDRTRWSGLAARDRMGEERLEAVLRAFRPVPALAVHHGDVDPAAYLDSETDAIPNRAVVPEIAPCAREPGPRSGPPGSCSTTTASPRPPRMSR